jgi:hypothetical protein
VLLFGNETFTGVEVGSLLVGEEGIVCDAVNGIMN